ncbi:LysM peptidoglycan-binding domain-containing protein [Streptococcus caprae]
MTKQVLAASTLLVTFVPATSQAITWTARSIADIKADIASQTSNQQTSVQENDQTTSSGQTQIQTYTVKYGDTLSTIAEALGIDLVTLAHINDIADMDLIYPDTVLKLSYDQKQQLAGVEIQAPAASTSQEAIAPEQAATPVVPQSETIQVETTVAETVTEAPVTEAETTVAEEVTEAVSEETIQAATEAPVETAVAETVTEAPVTEVETTVAEEVTEAVSEETTQAATEAPVETTVAETVTEVETTVAEEVTEAVSEETTQAATEAPVETTVAETVTEAPTTLAPETTEAPVTEAETTTTATYTAAAGEDYGLQPQTIALKNEIAGLYGITNFSLYRPGDSGDHGKGLAVDFMVYSNSALGDVVANYAAENMGSKGIAYIIWKQRFYSPYPSKYGPAYTWNLMEDRGSVTENHYDHVHVSLNP